MVRFVRFLSVAAVLFFTACDKSIQNVPVQVAEDSEPVYQKEYARVRKYKGIYVFINSQPVNQYEELGTISASVWDNLKIEKGDRAGTVIRRISNSEKEHITLSDMLEKVITNATLEYPEAEGVIFTDKMNSCQVVKFEN